MQHNLRLTKGHDRDTYRAHYNPPQTTAANGQNPTERDTPPIQLTRAREPPPPSHARQSGLTHKAACHKQEREPPVDGGTAKQGPCLPRAPPHDNPPLHNPPPTKNPIPTTTRSERPRQATAAPHQTPSTPPPHRLRRSSPAHLAYGPADTPIPSQPTAAAVTRTTEDAAPLLRGEAGVGAHPTPTRPTPPPTTTKRQN